MRKSSWVRASSIIRFKEGMFDELKNFKCSEPECIELYEKESLNIELLLNLEETTTTQYKISEAGTLRATDSDYEQKFWLSCPCCNAEYKFAREQIEVDRSARLCFYFDTSDDDNLQINKTKTI